MRWVFSFFFQSLSFYLNLHFSSFQVLNEFIKDIIDESFTESCHFDITCDQSCDSQYLPTPDMRRKVRSCRKAKCECKPGYKKKFGICIRSYTYEECQCPCECKQADKVVKMKVSVYRSRGVVLRMTLYKVRRNFCFCFSGWRSMPTSWAAMCSGL